MNFLSFVSFLLAFMFVLAVKEEIIEVEKPSDSENTVKSEAENLLDIEDQDSDSISLSEEDIDEEYKNERKKYEDELGINPEDYNTQKKLPFVIQATTASVLKVVNKKSPKVVEEKGICYVICTALDYLQLYVPNAEEFLKSREIKEYDDFVYVGIKKDNEIEVALTPTCPMESSQQNPLREQLMNSVKNSPDDISKPITINILQPVKIIKNTKYIFWPSTEPCNDEIELSFFKASPENRNYHEYEAGYVVKMNNPVLNCVENIKYLGNDMLFFHIGLFGIDKQTEDTVFAFHYIPYYDIVREMGKPTAVYTNYTVDKNIHPQGVNFDHIYKKSNQQRIFKTLFELNYESYFNPEKGLILVKQELIDQKMLLTMTFKQVALSYTNIVPMFKTIQDNAWRAVEEAISSIPGVLSINILSGVLHTLEIEETSIYLDDETDGQVKKTVRVPRVFYKFVLARAEHHKTSKIHRFGIYIITHNNPFDMNPTKICEQKDIIPCENFGNLKEEENAMHGITYCCKHSDHMVKELGIEKKNIEDHDVFDINKLKDVVGAEQLNKSSQHRKIPEVKKTTWVPLTSFDSTTYKYDKAILNLQKIFKKYTKELLSNKDTMIKENSNLSANSNPAQNSNPMLDSGLSQAPNPIQTSGATKLGTKDH